MGAPPGARAQEADRAAAALNSVRQELGAAAQSDGPPALAPDQFIISRDPPGLRSGPTPATEASVSTRPETEKPQAVAGTTYTVIAPIYLGGGPDGGNTSYIRLFNNESRSSTFRINIVGYKTDAPGDSQSAIIGTTSIVVPKWASPQYSIAEIFLASNLSTAALTYQGVALYITNVDLNVGYQHVIHNANSRFFENVTLCGDSSYSDGTASRYSASLINVHSDNFYMTEYPSSVMMHNYAPSNQTYETFVIDSRTGAVLGSWIATLLANSTYVIPMSYILREARVTATDMQSHVNFQIFRPVGSSVGLLNTISGSLIYNQALQAYVNMTQVCKILH